MVRPLQEMQNNMKLIRRTMTKREHKLVDYDRYRLSLKKLADKKERTLSDEKQIYKVRLLYVFPVTPPNSLPSRLYVLTVYNPPSLLNNEIAGVAIGGSHGRLRGAERVAEEGTPWVLLLQHKVDGTHLQLILLFAAPHLQHHARAHHPTCQQWLLRSDHGRPPRL